MPANPKPYLKFKHSVALRKRTLKVLDAIDEDDDPVAHRKDLSDIIVELSETGLHYFFIAPLNKLKMGFVVNQSANLGVNGTMRVLGPTVRNIVSRMDKKQMRSVSKQMRAMMV